MVSCVNIRYVCSNFNSIWVKPHLNFPCYKDIVVQTLKKPPQTVSVDFHNDEKILKVGIVNGYDESNIDPETHPRKFSLVFSQKDKIYIDDSQKKPSSFQLICYKISLTFNMIISTAFNHKLNHIFIIVEDCSMQHEIVEQRVMEMEKKRFTREPTYGRRHFNYFIDSKPPQHKLV